MAKEKIFGFLTVFLGVLFLFSCKETQNKKTLEIRRYDQALVSMDLSRLSAELKKYQADYPLFLEGADLEDTLTLLRMYNFLSDPMLRTSSERVKKVYPDLSSLSSDLAEFFDRAKLYFPETQTPTVYTYLSNFSYQDKIIYEDTVLAIALDMYLGSEEKAYSMVGIPVYLSKRLNPENIMADIAYAYVQKKLPSMEQNNFLEVLILSGKQMWLLNQLLPKVPSHIKLGYTEEQWKWCVKNEAALWNHLVKEQLLYSTDFFMLKYFIHDGPGNTPFQGAPPRLAQWIGLRIIQEMEKKGIKTEQILQNIDAGSCLRLSSYRPK